MSLNEAWIHCDTNFLNFKAACHFGHGLDQQVDIIMHEGTVYVGLAVSSEVSSGDDST